MEWPSSLCTVYIYIDTSAYVRVWMNVWLPVYEGLQFDEEFAFKCVLATCACMINVTVMSRRGMCVIICSLNCVHIPLPSAPVSLYFLALETGDEATCTYTKLISLGNRVDHKNVIHVSDCSVEYQALHLFAYPCTCPHMYIVVCPCICSYMYYSTH